MAAHTLKILKGYVSRSGRKVYECTCKNTVEAWSLAEAIKGHREDLKMIESICELNKKLDEAPVPTKGRQVYYQGEIYK